MSTLSKTSLTDNCREFPEYIVTERYLKFSIILCFRRCFSSELGIHLPFWFVYSFSMGLDFEKFQRNRLCFLEELQ